MKELPSSANPGGRSPARCRDALALRALACVPVVAVYGFLRLLMLIVPKPVPMAESNREAPPPRPGRPLLSALPIRWAVRLYRYSLVHHSLHRKGERCLFLPSCTEYAARVSERYGLVEGLIRIGDRFRRCRADTTEEFVDFP